MLQTDYVRKHRQEVEQRLRIKGFNETEQIEQLLEADSQRRQTQSQLDETLAQSKSMAKAIGQLVKEGKQEEAQKAKTQTAQLKQTAKDLQEKLNNLAEKQKQLLLEIPNLPHPDVPKGKGEQDNLIVKESPNPTEQSNEKLLPHWELAKIFNLIDFELGAKVTGAGFPVYLNDAARMQRALVSFFLDQARSLGYMEVQPPLLVNENAAFGTGQLPDKDGQMYHVTNDNLYLIPTAEVPLTNLYAGKILDTSQMPVKVTGYTPCFRREAGSYGKDVKGLNRLHQFDKVEIVQIVQPDRSYKVLEEMTQYVVSLVEKLQLPYRLLKLCGGDTSFAAAMTYDVEVYAKAQKKWLEVSSISNFESFQSTRMKLRGKDKNKNKITPHTLNGSALALPRVMAAIMENNQAHNKIKVPPPIVEYMGKEFITIP